MVNYKVVYDVDDEILSELIKLDKTFYDVSDIGSFELCRQFLSKNKDIYTVLMKDENPVGYISFFPISKAAYSKFKNGQLRDYQLTVDDILPFSEEKELDCIFSSIVIDKKLHKSKAIACLLRGFLNHIQGLNVKINRIIFDCVSDEGEKLALIFGSTPIPNKSNRKIFELNMDKFKNVSNYIPTLKAGCYLVDVNSKKIALIYRDVQNDWTFPKGHLEAGETLKECAIRETAEETKRDSEVVDDIEPIIEMYITPSGEICECSMFVAVDKGKSDNNSEETHDTFWFDIADVEEKLSYDGLKKSWKIIKKSIEKLLEKGNN